MAPPDVQDGNEQGIPTAEENAQNNLVGVETSHRRRRCCVLIVAVVLCLFIIGGGASVPFVLNMINQSGFNSTQLRPTSEPTVNTSQAAPTVIVTSYSWGGWSPWSPCSITTCDVEVSRRERVCTMRKGVAKDSRTADCDVGLSSQETRKCPLALVSYCTDCAEIKSTVTDSTNGTYLIDPDGRRPFQVYCDMTTDGGGWTVFQRRQDGSEDFNRTWDEYKTGFGNLSGEFWLGNEYIHRLTYNRNKTLRIDMVNAVSSYYGEVYEKFNISSESEEYTFYVGTNIHDRYDSLRWIEHNQMFSTVDRDNEVNWYRNIAAEIGGGWWYMYDRYSKSPNGLYGSRFGWYDTYHPYGKLTYCDMKVK